MPAWYDDLAASVASGALTYLVCGACGATATAPRTICPECGEPDLGERSLSDTATVETFTEIYVTIPRFDGETPYTVVLGAFDEGVRLTGQLRGADADAIDIGDAVRIGVEEREEGSDLLTFTPESSDG
ncbi:MAG: Zn-ribbon domain-containing OB-fold protein [Haloarculaceae archaeon]